MSDTTASTPDTSQKESKVAEQNRNEMNLVELKSKNIRELLGMARELNIEGASSMRKQELIFASLRVLNGPSMKQAAPRPHFNSR